MFDEMCEWWNVLPNVSMSFPRYSRVNYVEEMSASLQHETSGSERMKDSSFGCV